MIFSKSELISLAFITPFDENELKDEIMYSAISKYIIPVVTPSIYQQAVNDPHAYQELIEGYIKPCLAFYVKYLHLQQLFLESKFFIAPEISNVKNNVRDAVAEVLIIAEQKQLDLTKFVKANYFPEPTPLPTNSKLISGFLL